MYIPEFAVGMFVGFALGISALIIAAVVYSKKSSDEQGAEGGGVDGEQ